MILSISDTNNGDDELADNHTSGTPDKQWATAEPFNSPEGERGGADVDKGRDQADQEWV